MRSKRVLLLSIALLAMWLLGFSSVYAVGATFVVNTCVSHSATCEFVSASIFATTP